MASTVLVDDQAALVVEIQKRGVKLVGIDGDLGVEKSTLVRQIADQLCAAYLSLDCWLNKDQGRYADALRLDEVALALQCARNAAPLVIVECICLLDVMQRLHVTPALLVYVQARSAAGLDMVPEPPEFISPRLLSHDIAVYHQLFQPRAVADIEYVRQERDLLPGDEGYSFLDGGGEPLSYPPRAD